MPKKSNNEKKKDAEAAGRPPKKTKQANKILIVNMVFCYQNCSDLLGEKIVLVIEKNF